jgi:hypothetical protein
VGHVGVTYRCSFPIVGRRERARVGRVPRPQVQGELWCASGDRPSSRGTDWPQTMVGWPGELAGRLAIFADGAPVLQWPLLQHISSSVGLSMRPTHTT